MVARNMYRIAINVYEKELCIKLVIYKNFTKMYGQQNIKLLFILVCLIGQKICLLID